MVLAEDIRGKVAEPDVRARIESELAALLKQVNAAIPEYERLQMLVIAREPFSIEGGTLTPTMKIKRSRIEADVAANLDAWYGVNKPVVWA